jgi:hypothetical protein
MTRRIRYGASLARGTTIDAYLSEETCKVLYERWKTEWGEPLMFSGGITALTCEMVLEAPEKELKDTYKKYFDEIISVSRNNAAR